MVPGTRRRITSAPATRDSRSGTRATRASASPSAGTSGFPECARAMALKGAELLFYPTAIGSEPPPALPVNSRDHWQRTQQGHAAANLDAGRSSRNRIGTERALQDPDKRLHPLLWIELHRRTPARRSPKPTRKARRCSRQNLISPQNDELRNNWFVFRDRRPELYGALTTYDGGTHGRARRKNWLRSMRCSRVPIDHDGQIDFTEFKTLVLELDADGLPPRLCASASTRPTPTAMAASTSMSSARGGSANERGRMRPAGNWWRRRELNPRPQALDVGLYVRSCFFVFSPCATRRAGKTPEPATVTLNGSARSTRNRDPMNATRVSVA